MRQNNTLKNVYFIIIIQLLFFYKYEIVCMLAWISMAQVIFMNWCVGNMWGGLDIDIVIVVIVAPVGCHQAL